MDENLWAARAVTVCVLIGISYGFAINFFFPLPRECFRKMLNRVEDLDEEWVHEQW